MIKITALGLLATLLMIGCERDPPAPPRPVIQFGCVSDGMITLKMQGTRAEMEVKSDPQGVARQFTVMLHNDWNGFVPYIHQMQPHEVCGVWDGQQVVE